jgi:ATP-dependent DNA helicase RecG
MNATEAINPINILEKLDWLEKDDLEFKSARGGVPKSLWETYSAMANTHGGVILLGVEDDGHISGVNNLKHIKKSFWDTINNRGKVSINLLSNRDVQEVAHPSGTILVIKVPQANRYQRPVFLERNPLTGTYRRNCEGDYHCSEQEVSRMLSDRAEDPADSRILKHFSLADLDHNSVQQYRQRFASHKPTHPWLGEDDRGLLLKLGGWRCNRQDASEGLTVAGLLMFGREETIREVLPQYHVDFREKLSDDPQLRWTDRLTLDGTWAGNLFQFYLRVIQRLSVDLKLQFQLDTDLFRKGETVVHEAIREALANALIHADHQGQGGIIVERYRDRFEFSNPGTLLISIDQLLRGNVSECRNKSLQLMFMMIGGAEKAGSGVDKIRRGWESQHWRSPKVSEQVQPDRVLWMLPMVSMIPDVSLERLNALFGARFLKFDKLEVQALVTADLEGSVDNARMRQITDGHPADMTRLLQSLVARGALFQEGHGRWSRYRLPVSIGLSAKKSHSLHNDVDSLHNDVDSLHNDVDSLHEDDQSLSKVKKSLHNKELLTLAAPARVRQRIPPKDMEKIVLDLCCGRWLSRNEIATLVARNSEGLRQRFLNPMVEHGLLRLRYPDKPNRTDQAYTAANGEN